MIVALAAAYTPEIFERDRILTFDFEDGEELEDVTPGYAEECHREYADLIAFLDDWENNLFTVGLSEYQHIPYVTQTFRRIHKKWLNEQRRERRKK